ncbi:hypothetical protein Phi14:2_gp111 [Cellulophaga phage phi14:2]|uniref:Uncharacterized protein n=1 Tax=Cellulophaga phage phi14:2 TaxID=1327990 RepID=S0A094_9CAUD|nr:hypothetical protein Phi14:2_gp111 [Cellulophaga phage phi14:2]
MNNYDEEPVECCSRCKNLHLIKESETSPDVSCTKCGDINNVERLDSIHEYIDKYGMIWNIG